MLICTYRRSFITSTGTKIIQATISANIPPAKYDKLGFFWKKGDSRE
jgi:hypothetical protein